MLKDNLTKKKLATMIGSARFNLASEFKDFLKDKLLENFSIEADRMGDQTVETGGRHDVMIYDELTKREAILVIGLKTISSTPKFTDEDIALFHTTCQKAKTLYGVLMTETEVHFYQYRSAGGENFVDEIEKLEPLNYVDYEASKTMDKQKIKDILLAKKKWVIGFGLFVILMISTSMANAQACKARGVILGEVNKDGIKVYLLPADSGYNKAVTGDQKGERRFCNEQDAMDKGFTRPKK